MKKSHIAVIALSISIAVLALFVGNSDIGADATAENYEIHTIEAE